MSQRVRLHEGDRALRRVRPTSRRQFEAARAALGHVWALRPGRRMEDPVPPPVIPQAPRSKVVPAQIDTMPRNENVIRCDSSLYPPSMICPICYEVFKDPVICEDGFSYERQPVTRWLLAHCKSPMTGSPMGGRILPNHTLRLAIDELTASCIDKV